MAKNQTVYQCQNPHCEASKEGTPGRQDKQREGKIRCTECNRTIPEWSIKQGAAFLKEADEQPKSEASK